MSRSPRHLFAVALWLVALWPLALLLLGLWAPTAAVRSAALASRATGWALWGLGAVTLAAIALYPPFLPGLRLRLRRGWQRLATSDQPVRDAYARLQQFATVNDHFAVGRYLRERGQAAAAVQHLQAAVQLDATHWNARYQLALAERDRGQLQAAVDELQRVLAHDIGFAAGQPLLDLATILEQSGNAAPADRVLVEFRRLHGDSRAGLLLHARVLAALGRGAESRAALQQAAQAPPPGTHVSLEEAHARARARVALWLGGYR